MQKAFLIIVALGALTNTYGQKTEFRASLNSGLFSFAGKSAEAASAINYNDQSESGYTNNPYGSENGVGIGFSGSIKRVSRKNFMLGIDAGYDILRSKIRIDRINSYTGSATYTYDATGKTTLQYSFLNVYPFLGYRVPAGKLNIDITGGLDLSHCLHAKEKGKAKASNGTRYETSVDRKTIKNDIRPRIQLTASYEKFGAYVGYSLGLKNYRSGYDGGTNECFARLFRFGLTYQIK